MQSAFDPQQLLVAIGDGIVVSDPDGVIVTWNPAAERIFGYSEAEALGHSLDLIIPEKQRDRHWEAYHQTMRTGQTRYATDVLRVPAIDKQGRRLSIAFTVALLYSESSEVSGIVAVIRDETARFNEERALRSRLAALEQTAQ